MTQPPHRDAARRGDKPSRPMRPDTRVRVPRPDFPPGVKPDLPKRVYSELRHAIKSPQTAEEVAVALTLAGEAIDEGLPDVAIEYLTWAKSVTPRSVTVREALGVARYLDEDYQAALNELRAYKRMAGSRDQSHLIADCLRALGQPVAAVAAEVEELLADTRVPAERRIEGLIVWASALADVGELDGGRAVLRRGAGELLAAAGDAASQRYQYVVGELALRAGDDLAARTAWGPLSLLEGDPFEVRPRLDEQAG